MTAYVGPTSPATTHLADLLGLMRGKPVAHLTADSADELHELARALDVPAGRWMGGTPNWHYVVTGAERAAAVVRGAREVRPVDLFVLSRERARSNAAPARPLVAVAPAPSSTVEPHPEPAPAPAVTPAPDGANGSARKRAPARWNPETKRHSWDHRREHFYVCRWCGLKATRNEPLRPGMSWYWTWRWDDWPDGQVGSELVDGKRPRCRGPRSL